MRKWDGAKSKLVGFNLMGQETEEEKVLMYTQCWSGKKRGLGENCPIEEVMKVLVDIREGKAMEEGKVLMDIQCL